MIKAKDAIDVARSLIGTPYAELDCINLIKKVIRTAPGGVANYTTAGTNTLWHSYNAALRYRDLTWRQESLADAGAGMLAFKRYGADDEGHVGIVTEKGTVIHSSSTQGGRGVVETPLSAAEGWDMLAIHRYIQVKGDKEDEIVNSKIPFNAVVDTVSGPLNLREEPSANAMIIEKMPKGSIVEVVEKTNLEWWKVCYKGETGYASEEYLSRILENTTPSVMEGTAAVQIVITDEAGNTFHPMGRCTVDLKTI